MELVLRPAVRQKAKLRIGISGPSGSGKTYSAILLAKGIIGDLSKVAVIDTENGSADLYSHLGPYNVMRLEAPYSPECYIEAINACVGAGMQLIIIDSVSHEWDGKGGCLEINESVAKVRFKGNVWSAFSETTPRHQRFIETIVSSPVHVITTARSKTDTVMTDDKKVKKVGTKEIQREGFEYELTINYALDRDGNYATVSKDRTGLFITRDPFRLDEKVGQELKNWAESGVDEVKPINPDALKRVIFDHMKRLGDVPKNHVESAQLIAKYTGLNLEEQNYPRIIEILELIPSTVPLSNPEVAEPVKPAEPSPISPPVQEAPIVKTQVKTEKASLDRLMKPNPETHDESAGDQTPETVQGA